METNLIKPSDMALVDMNALNGKQMKHLFKKTPSQFVRERPAKGGGKWKYVSGGYVKKCLNLMFGFDWDFEIQEQLILHGEAIVKGKLTCRSNGKTIVKTQFGNKDIVYKKEPTANGDKIPLSIGNDLKAAATDCLKKCAAEIGIAADIYNAEEFREVLVDTTETVTITELESLLQAAELFDLDERLRANAKRIIEGNETGSFETLKRELIAVRG
jgi:hypothetical protein